jgi:YidC/Oxa1 family membrane protein insertase
VEKRLFVFVVVSILIWGGFLLLQATIAPPKPKPIAAKPGDKNKVDNKQAEKVEPDKKPDEVKRPAEQPAANNVARRRVTLGSLDPTSGYHLLVTLDNQGAAIERIELTTATTIWMTAPATWANSP